jgi:diaminopimelate decarboxylase
MTRANQRRENVLAHIDVQALAKRVPTPFYAYCAIAIRRRIASLQAALRGVDATICYAVKANSNLAILRLMSEAGLGADIVSAGELQRSLRAGIPAKRIVFSGVGKTDDEIAAALAAGVWKFNVESRDELQSLQRLARERQVIAHAAVRINPDVDAGTHEKISTARRKTSSASASLRRGAGSQTPASFRTFISTGCTCTSARRS